MEFIALFFKTFLFRPYVFVFLTAFLFSAIQLLGWQRTWRFFLISWGTAFACEFSSTRTGIPFGLYHYNGSTVGQELYLSNIPFMVSISFSFLLYGAYCVTLCLLLPRDESASASRLLPLRFDMSTRTSWPILFLTALLFAVIDMVIDPIALRGDRWFLGKIYYYSDPGIHFGVPLVNYLGWVVVGLISLLIWFPLDRRLTPIPTTTGTFVTQRILLGVGLYYSVLVFNLTVTFWIGEPLQGLTGLFLCMPVTVLLLLRLFSYLPAHADL